MSRTTIPAAQLYAIFDREFRNLTSAVCGRCHAPLPYYREPPDDVSANWNIAPPPNCENGCHRAVAELVTTLWSRFDIEPERAQ